MKLLGELISYLMSFCSVLNIFLLIFCLKLLLIVPVTNKFPLIFELPVITTDPDKFVSPAVSSFKVVAPENT